MYIADQFVYIELSKTGTSTMNYWLAQLIEGRQEGKHNRPNESILNGDKKFIATIRNPWEWYLSLWSYGCTDHGKSGPYTALTRWNPLRSQHGFSIHPSKAILNFLKRSTVGLFQDYKLNKSLYADASNPELFRQWLQLVCNPSNDWLLSGFYASTKMSSYAGLMSYKYTAMFCRDIEQLSKCPIPSLSALKRWEKEHSYIDHFLELSHLKQDFLKLMPSLGYDLSEQVFNDKIKILSKNETGSSKQMQKYYDAQSIALVHEREQLIIDKFNYKAPIL